MSIRKYLTDMVQKVALNRWDGYQTHYQQDPSPNIIGQLSADKTTFTGPDGTVYNVTAMRGDPGDICSATVTSGGVVPTYETCPQIQVGNPSVAYIILQQNNTSNYFLKKFNDKNLYPIPVSTFFPNINTLTTLQVNICQNCKHILIGTSTNFGGPKPGIQLNWVVLQNFTVNPLTVTLKYTPITGTYTIQDQLNYPMITVPTVPPSTTLTWQIINPNPPNQDNDSIGFGWGPGTQGTMTTNYAVSTDPNIAPYTSLQQTIANEGGYVFSSSSASNYVIDWIGDYATTASQMLAYQVQSESGVDTYNYLAEYQNIVGQALPIDVCDASDAWTFNYNWGNSQYSYLCGTASSTNICTGFSVPNASGVCTVESQTWSNTAACTATVVDVTNSNCYGTPGLPGPGGNSNYASIPLGCYSFLYFNDLVANLLDCTPFVNNYPPNACKYGTPVIGTAYEVPVMMTLTASGSINSVYNIQGLQTTDPTPAYLESQYKTQMVTQKLNTMLISASSMCTEIQTLFPFPVLNNASMVINYTQYSLNTQITNTQISDLGQYLSGFKAITGGTAALNKSKSTGNYYYLQPYNTKVEQITSYPGYPPGYTDKLMPNSFTTPPVSPIVSKGLDSYLLAYLSETAANKYDILYKYRYLIETQTLVQNKKIMDLDALVLTNYTPVDIGIT